MDKQEKNVLFGLLGALVIGVITYLVSSEAAQEKVETVINRQRAKHFVKDKLKGNQRALDKIDKMSNSEINSLLNNVDKMSDLESKLEDYSDELKNATKNLKKTIMSTSKSIKKKFN